MFKLENVKITDKMRSEAFFTFRNGHARINANYPLALEILKQLDNDIYIPFAWEVPQYINEIADKVNDILFKEYLISIKER